MRAGRVSLRRSGVRIFTCSVYPDLTRVWFRVLSRTFEGSLPPTLIFDCGGGLRPDRFPGAEIRRVPNWDHGRKIDMAMEILAGQDPVLIVDDDAFLLSRAIIDRGLDHLASDEHAAAYTFHCRDWWQLPAAGALHVPMGSYALLVKPDVIRREGLSFRTVKTADPAIRNGSGYWDTADYCQKDLLERGYAIQYAPETDREEMPTFFGTSGGFLTFARRSILTRRFVRRWSWRRTAQSVVSDGYSFQRGCSVTAVIDLHRRLTSQEPVFGDWYEEPALRSHAAALPSSDTREKLLSAADRIFRIRDRIVTS